MDIEKHKRLIAASAKRYLNDFAVSVIPLGRSEHSQMTEKERIQAGKRPAGEWEQFQQRSATVEESQSWNCTNIGLVTGAISGIIVVDCESREDAEWFFKQRGGRSNTIVQTPRGFHFYFYSNGQTVPNAQRIEGRYDIRGDGGYVVAPPSIVNGKQYRFVAGHSMRQQTEMVPFQMRWRYPGDGAGEAASSKDRKAITNGLAYIKTFHAVGGQGGHNTTFKAVNRLKDSGMSEGEAMAALIEWNQTNCDPPWTVAELLHKLKSVYGS